MEYRKLLTLLPLLATLVLPNLAHAENTQNLPVIEVVGQSDDDIYKIPGAAAVIKKEAIEAAQPYTVNEILRSVSGLSVRDEDGLGLRPNISVRGIPGDRSRKVLMLEDGVPISLAPYGENSAYYSPEIERIERIEVRKGSGSIAYGPQTIGGVINFITPEPPTKPTYTSKLSVGNRSFKSLQLGYGGTWNGTGLLLSVLNKQGDGPRSPMPFSIYDITGKMHTRLTPFSDLIFKVHYYNEDAKVTYTGLTQAEYDANHKQNPAVNDSLYVERVGFSGTHRYQGFDLSELNTTFYTHYIKRDWWRQDKSSTLDANGNRVFTDTNGGRNRSYKVAGLEPRLTRGALSAGLKLHYEEEHNQRINGNSPTARTARKGFDKNDGVKDDEIRSTLATAAFAQYAFNPSPKLHITPGLRVEAFRQRRDIRINSSTFATTSNAGVTSDITVPVATNGSVQVELIPGLGLTYDLSEKTNIFAGVHRGFAPPRFSDAINNTGEDQKLDAERSWNYEIGLRSKLLPWLKTEATVFFYDYSNQVISASESGGLTKVNAGKSQNKGVEVSAEASKKMGASIVRAGLSGTYVDAKFKSDITDSKGNVMSTNGKQIPYVPKGSIKASLGFAHKLGFQATFEGVYSSAQFSDELNTTTASADGEVGTIPSHTVFNLNGDYTINKKYKVFASVKNIFDKKYIASRNPEGIFPGLSRQINVGIKATF